MKFSRLKDTSAHPKNPPILAAFDTCINDIFLQNVYCQQFFKTERNTPDEINIWKTRKPRVRVQNLTFFKFSPRFSEKQPNGSKQQLIL